LRDALDASPALSRLPRVFTPGTKLIEGRQTSKYIAHALDHGRIRPISTPKQHQAWFVCATEGQQSRVIKVGSYNGSLIHHCPSDDFGVRHPIQGQIERMHSIVALNI